MDKITQEFLIQPMVCPQCEYKFIHACGRPLPACPICRAEPVPNGETEMHIADLTPKRGKVIK